MKGKTERATHPHRWDVSPRKAMEIQREWASRVRVEKLTAPVRLVGGLDLSIERESETAWAAVVLWDLRRREISETSIARRKMRFPYVPGLLSFREAPALLAALRKLTTRPDVLMCDGQGLAHPRRFGIACHMGLLTDLPSIGCAKSLLIGTHGSLREKRGSRAALKDGSDQVGAVLRTRDGVKPVYVSVGHKIDLRGAERIVLACAAGCRLPEPIRLADQLSRQAAREGNGKRKTEDGK